MRNRYIKIVIASILVILVLKHVLAIFEGIYEVTASEFRKALATGMIKEASISAIGLGMMKVICMTVDDRKFKIIMPLEEKATAYIENLCPIVRFNEPGGETSILDVALSVLFQAIVYFFIFGFNFRSPVSTDFSITKNEVKFSDIAGLSKEKREVMFAIDMLKNAEKYRRQGLSLTKGILFFGPPGNGKTMLAKAIAGEAGINFIAASGSEFDEVYVGVGPSRMRELFNKARKNAPIVIFIDEIDTIGGSRSKSFGNFGVNATLNQLLCELDGFKDNGEVLVIVATNFPGILDPALVRPGRIDKTIAFSNPNFDDRVAIINKKLEGRSIREELTPELIAGTTGGFSSASLVNVLNEMFVVSARVGHKQATLEDFNEAFENQVFGLETSLKMDEEEIAMTAYHEVGHALLAMFFRQKKAIKRRPYKISIIPRSKYLGALFLIDEERDPVTASKAEMEAHVCIVLGGKAAEQVFFGENKTTTGATSDLSKATEMLNNMFRNYGMYSSKIRREDVRFESEKYKEEADDTISRKLDEMFEYCCAFLRINKVLVHFMVDELVKNKEITFIRMQEIVNTNVILDPKIHNSLTGSSN